MIPGELDSVAGGNKEVTLNMPFGNQIVVNQTGNSVLGMIITKDGHVFTSQT